MIDENSLEQAAKESAEKCQIKYGRDFTQAVDMFKRGAEWMAKQENANKEILAKRLEIAIGALEEIFEYSSSSDSWE